MMSPKLDGPDTMSLKSSHAAHSIQPSTYSWQVERFGKIHSLNFLILSDIELLIGLL